MRFRLLLLPLLSFFVDVAVLGAADVPAIKPDQVVGSVYGKKITAADIELTVPIDTTLKFDSRNDAQWELMGRIMKAFGSPIFERFIKEQKIEATADEIRAYKKQSQKQNDLFIRKEEVELAEMQAKLLAGELSDEAKAKLEEQKTQIEKRLLSRRDRLGREGSDELARYFILPWKTDRAMHRIYGGRVIFQQFGPEALDARRRLFEQAEKDGDLKFEDAGVRHRFYYYANMKHVVIDEQTLENRKQFFFGNGD